jgi:hypothetical protein
MSTPTQYWAAQPTEQFGKEVIRRVNSYYEYLLNSGMLRKYRKSYDTYYGYSASGFFQSTSDVIQGGEQGELSLLKVNHYRNLTVHLLNLTTQSRPALECRAANTDVKTQAQTILGNGILEYYMRDKRLERYLKTATEHALIWGEGFIYMGWDANLGQPYMVDPGTGQPVNEGDICYHNPMGPLDMIRDPYLIDNQNMDWRIMRQYVNKFDLMAQYPECADEIFAVSNNLAKDAYYQISTPGIIQDSPLIPIFTVMHKKSPALPQGRLATVITSDLVLIDGAMPYDNLPGGLPVFRIAAADFYGTAFGYSPVWDLMGIQDTVDALHSTIVTNQTTFGVQNVLVPKGHDLSVQQLTGGCNLLEYDPQLGKPEALSLVSTKPEIFEYLKSAVADMEILSGVNSVARGEPPSNLKSGAALALVASQAIQFNSGLQGSYVALLEDVGTATIRMLQTFANTKRVASIAGKSRRYMIQEFNKDDISDINHVAVDVANPVSQTVSGRLEMAEQLMKVPGLIKSPDQYLQVVQTGRIEPLIEGEEASLMTIRMENEILEEGGQTQAVLTDNHKLHIQEHATVIATPDSRQNQAIVSAVLSHIQEHISLLTADNPFKANVLLITGQQPIQPPPPPQPPQPPQPPAPSPTPLGTLVMIPPGHGQPPPPQQHGTPPGHIQSGSGGGQTGHPNQQEHGGHPMSHPVKPPPHSPIPPAGNSITDKAQDIKGPLMPQNPLTGDRYNLQTGGLTPNGGPIVT